MYTTAELTWPKAIYVTKTITGLALVCIGLFDMESSIHEVFKLLWRSVRVRVW